MDSQKITRVSSDPSDLRRKKMYENEFLSYISKLKLEQKLCRVSSDTTNNVSKFKR